MNWISVGKTVSWQVFFMSVIREDMLDVKSKTFCSSEDKRVSVFCDGSGCCVWLVACTVTGWLSVRVSSVTYRISLPDWRPNMATLLCWYHLRRSSVSSIVFGRRFAAYCPASLSIAPWHNLMIACWYICSSGRFWKSAWLKKGPYQPILPRSPLVFVLLAWTVYVQFLANPWNQIVFLIYALNQSIPCLGQHCIKFTGFAFQTPA